MMFTIFDISIFTIILISTILGLYKGLLSIIVNLLGFIASIAVAIFLFPYIKEIIVPHLHNQLFASILSGIIAYILSLIAFTFATSKVVSLFGPISGGIVDRSLGFLLGIIRGLFISVTIFAILAVLTSGSYQKAENAKDLILNLDEKKYPDWLIISKTTSFLEGLLKGTAALLPENSLKSIKVPQSEAEKDSENTDDKIDSNSI